MREKLTHQFAMSVRPPDGKKTERYFDTNDRAPRGFLLRLTQAGARAWALQYRNIDGRQREITIGDPISWPLTEAWKRGHELRREIDAGRDPLDEREQRRQAPTVADLAQRFENESLPIRAVDTQREYRDMLRNYILPALGRLKLDSLGREDVEKLHRRITEAGKGKRANAVKSLVSTLFTQAIAWNLCADNPAKGIPNNREHARERYLTADEIARLIDVLDRWRQAGKHSDSVDAIRLLVLTGARRGEILGMCWGDLDLASAVWSKSPLKTKQRRVHRVPLSEAAIDVLRHRKAERDAGAKVVRLHGDDFVFRGGGAKSHARQLVSHWHVIRAAAGLEDVRVHDLRHSFASILVSEGLSLEIIGKMLGHSKSSTTSRYAHLADAPLRKAAEIVAGKVRR
jgi:integrase